MTEIVSSTEPAIGFCCEKTNDGWSWTLTTRLGEMLRDLEERYGQRDRAWTPLGIEFGGDIPRIWYPGNCRNVSIKLSTNARDNPRKAIFQLAHEAVHLLSPSGGSNGPAIEEGLAVLYSEEVTARSRANIRYDDKAYLYCRQITHDFLEKFGGSDKIKALRAKEPAFSRWDAQFLVSECPPCQASWRPACARTFPPCKQSERYGLSFPQLVIEAIVYIPIPSTRRCSSITISSACRACRASISARSASSFSFLRVRLGIGVPEAKSAAARSNVRRANISRSFARASAP